MLSTGHMLAIEHVSLLLFGILDNVSFLSPVHTQGKLRVHTFFFRDYKLVSEEENGSWLDSVINMSYSFHFNALC